MYTNSTYNTRVTRFLVGANGQEVAFGTATSSATGTLTVSATGASPCAPFIRATVITNIQVYTGVVAKSGTTASLIFMNGTSTVATCTPPTAGTWALATMPTTTNTNGQGATQTNTTYYPFAALGSMTIKALSTATASADVLGSYVIAAEIQEVYA